MAPTPSSKMRRLARLKLDQLGVIWREALGRTRGTPNGGWIAATREALAMSQSDLARRLGVNPSSIVKLEARERMGTIQLDTMRRAAEAMGCELVVAFVPRQSLQSVVDQQRVNRFGAMLRNINTHMNLEDQPISDALQRHLIEQAEDAVPDSELWREPDVG